MKVLPSVSNICPSSNMKHWSMYSQMERPKHSPYMRQRDNKGRIEMEICIKWVSLLTSVHSTFTESAHSFTQVPSATAEHMPHLISQKSVHHSLSLVHSYLFIHPFLFTQNQLIFLSYKSILELSVLSSPHFISLGATSPLQYLYHPSCLSCPSVCLHKDPIHLQLLNYGHYSTPMGPKQTPARLE